MLRIIDNKKVDITNDEYEAYQNICKSYDRPNFQGKDLFTDLFETDDKGIIVFLKPPNTKFVSMEVLTFLQSVMMHQHLRLMYEEIDASKKKLEEETMKHLKDITDELKQLKEEVESIKSKKK